MKIAVVVGSQRENSQSAKVGQVIAEKLDLQGDDNSVELIELSATPLPLWDVSLSEQGQSDLSEMESRVSDCDAFVIISPEWHGMVPAALKNFFLYFSGGQLAHKPALIVAVSAGDGGSYPIVELRTSSYKNSRICYLPEHLIIRHVESVFNPDGENDPKSQAYLEKRLDYALGVLQSYGAGMRLIREQLPDGSPFPNGM